MIKNIQGKRRVIIKNVRPQVDGGLYPAKRTVGETVKVSADIISDGHDYKRAFLQFKAPGAKRWSSQEMFHEVNDRWAATFPVTQTGDYVFKLHAWVDHFLTWYRGFLKKAEAGIEVKVELLEGAIMLKSLGQKASKNWKGKLLDYAGLFEDKEKYNKATQAVLGSDFAQLVEAHPMISNEATFDHELAVRVEDKRTNFTTWYEIFPRSTSPRPGAHGTFKDCEKLLSRVVAMGFDVLYLPPIHPIGEVNRKGKNNAVEAAPGEPGSPWAIGSKDGGHKSIHKELGTFKDYESLIKKAKAMGVDIALDLALQCAPDHPYVKEHPKWFKWRPDGTVQYAENPPKKYQDILPINFESEDWENLWEEMKSIVLFWIEHGVNIFRVDNPHTKPIPFWGWLIGEVKKDHPETIFLSEAFTKPKVMAALAKVGFTQSYTYFTWRVNKYELTGYMNELVHSESREYFRPNFWPNTPDILPYHLQQHGENAFIARFALAATLSSNYGMYGPVYEFMNNVPMDGKEEYFNSEKYEIKHHDWKKSNRLTDIIILVNKARKEHEALQSTWNMQFCEVQNDQLIAYLKATDDLSSIILVVVNLDPYNRQSGYLQMPLERLKIKGRPNFKLHDLVTEDQFTWTDEWNYIELDPYQFPFHLFQVKMAESQL